MVQLVTLVNCGYKYNVIILIYYTNDQNIKFKPHFIFYLKWN